jgi:hypothetical protein
MFVSLRFVSRISGWPAWPSLRALAGFLVGAAAGWAPRCLRPRVGQGGAGEISPIPPGLGPGRDGSPSGRRVGGDRERYDHGGSGWLSHRERGHRLALRVHRPLAPGEVQWSTAGRATPGSSRTGFRSSGPDGQHRRHLDFWHLRGDTVMVDSTPTRITRPRRPLERRVPDGGAQWRLFDAMNPYNGNILPSGAGALSGRALPVPGSIKTETWEGSGPISHAAFLTDAGASRGRPAFCCSASRREYRYGFPSPEAHRPGSGWRSPPRSA